MTFEPSSSLISIYPLVLPEFRHAVRRRTALGQTPSYFTQAGSFNRGCVRKLHAEFWQFLEKVCKTVFLMLDYLCTESSRDPERC